MDEFSYSKYAQMSPENLVQPSNHEFSMMDSAFRYGSDELTAATVTTKAMIASHPRFPRLLHAYIELLKVGAPPKMRSNIGMSMQDAGVRPRSSIEANPELDQFMENYCEILDKYKSDISRPFEETTNFLSNVEMELRNLCCPNTMTNSSQNQASLEVVEDDAVSSDEEYSGGEVDVHDAHPRDEDRDLIKDQLLRRYGSHISGLKLEFCKNRKKSKLSKDAKQLLFEWWNTHYMWPYPTEDDKTRLAEMTGLTQNQINNWFINQRKRHWRPMKNMTFDLMETISDLYFTED
ncbi:hypothetical protein RND81_07G193700 [Saponaria officinalis]|uniref:Uncharacterized protein n=1 Tax=Saponaria officinalis TaxID=3572 RepID=A0AAW1JQ78_SAPOF